MTHSDSAPSRGAGIALADELRTLLSTLHRIDLSTAQLEAAARAVRELTQGLTGPERLRWYEATEADAATQAEVRTTWRDFTLFAGEQQPLAPPLRTRIEQEQVLVGEATPNRMYEGPPGVVHGGYLAGLFDDLLGQTLRLLPGITAVTGRLEVRYRRPTPLDTPLRFEARLDRVRGRRIQARAVCLVDGLVTAEANALFVGRDLTNVDSVGPAT